MRLSQLLLYAVHAKRASESTGAADSVSCRRTEYIPATRRYGGYTRVGIPNKIAKRLGD